MIRKGKACESATGTGFGLSYRFALGVFGIDVRFIKLRHAAAFDSIVATLPFLLPPQLEVAHFNRNFQAPCDPIIFAKTGGELTAFEQAAV
jgi:hypothetical protein